MTLCHKTPYITITAHCMCISTIRQCVEGVDEKYFWKYDKIATVLLFIQCQNSLNKTPHPQKND